MRALATISAVILLGAGLAGCDMPWSQQQRAAARPCNCITTPPAMMTPPPAPTEHLTRFSYAPHHYYVRHRYYAQTRYRPPHYHGTYNIDRSQQSVDSYNYQSSSRVTQSTYSESEYTSRYTGAYYQNARIVWTDGYGRGYVNNGPVTVAATMRGERLRAYHGYGVDCPDDGEPR
jgi:hypothetical protein